MVLAQRESRSGHALLLAGFARAAPPVDRRLPEIVALVIPATISLELACNAGVVAKAYLNQHWIPGSPRRPALVPSDGFGHWTA